MSKIREWFKHSLTILWARFVTAAGVAIAIVLALGSDPGTNAAIQGLLGPYAPYWLIAMGIITELARRRTVSKATDANNQIVAG